MEVITQGLNNTGLNNSMPTNFFERGRSKSSSSSSSYVPSAESQTSQSQSQSSQSSDSSMSDNKVPTTAPSSTSSSKPRSTNKTEMKKFIANTPTKGLTSHEIANFRAARSIVELTTDKRAKHLNICIDGDKLNEEVRGFVKRAVIKRVKFMRMQKPINKAKTKKGKSIENPILKSSDYKSNRDEGRSEWDGDFQYNCAGRIQSISFEAPPILNKNGIKVGYDFKKLRDFLLSCTSDVFKTVNIEDDNLTTKRTSYRAHLRRQELFKDPNFLELS